MMNPASTAAIIGATLIALAVAVTVGGRWALDTYWRHTLPIRRIRPCGCRYVLTGRGRFLWIERRCRSHGARI